MAQKLWRVSQHLNKSPFHPEVLDHTEAELDFILEMTAQDYPDKWKFIRRTGEEALPRPQVLAAWEKVLVGRSHHEMIQQALGNPPESLLKKLRETIAPPVRPTIRKGPAADKKVP